MAPDSGSFLVALWPLFSYTAGHVLREGFKKWTINHKNTQEKLIPSHRNDCATPVIVLKYVLEICNDSIANIELIVEQPFLQFVFYPTWKAIIYSM